MRDENIYEAEELSEDNCTGSKSTSVRNALDLYEKVNRGSVQKGEVTHCAITRVL